MRPLRVRAERTAHAHALRGLVIAVLGRRNRLGRHALLDPLLERALDVEHVRPRPALAMIEPGRQEEAVEVRARVDPRRLGPVLSRLHTLVVVDQLARGDDRIGQPVVLDELATGGVERREVGLIALMVEASRSSTVFIPASKSKVRQSQLGS